MGGDAKLQAEIETIVEAPVDAGTGVLNLIQVFEKMGVDTIKSAVKRPLKELKAACYYGCLLVRPPAVTGFDDAEQPRTMEVVVAATGASTVDWNYRTECCGAGMTMASPETVLELSHRILGDAAAHGANCLAVACPMCHVNLDMKQAAIEKHYGVRYGLPVYYLSDLVGMALGLSAAELGTERHFVAEPVGTKEA
jgi:heterodisulfide reductase subunit B